MIQATGMCGRVLNGTRIGKPYEARKKPSKGIVVPSAKCFIKQTNNSFRYTVGVKLSRKRPSYLLL